MEAGGQRMVAGTVAIMLSNHVQQTQGFPRLDEMKRVALITTRAPVRARALLTQIEAFDGIKSIHSARRKVKRDARHRASFATTPMS